MFVLKWGPRFMKNRKPFNLDKILILYNALQVVACLYLFVNVSILVLLYFEHTLTLLMKVFRKVRCVILATGVLVWPDV